MALTPHPFRTVEQGWSDGAGRVGGRRVVINDSPLKAIGENRHAVQGNRWSSLMKSRTVVPGRQFVVVELRLVVRS
jgi:S-adenosylhomocysteine hydrolase